MLWCLLLATSADAQDESGPHGAPPVWHVHLTSAAQFISNGPWYGDGLQWAQRSGGRGGLGGELYMRHGHHWLIGIGLVQQRAYADALHPRVSMPEGIGTRHSGEQLGLDQHAFAVGPMLWYEPWPYPRRRLVGVALRFGVGAGYLGFTEQRFVIPNASVLVKSGLGRPTIKEFDPDHEGRQELGSDRRSSVYGQLLMRSDLHFGRTFSIFIDLGVRAVPHFNLGGSSFTGTDGIVLSIAPHTGRYSMFHTQGGMALHFSAVP